MMDSSTHPLFIHEKKTASLVIYQDCKYYIQDSMISDKRRRDEYGNGYDAHIGMISMMEQQ